MPEEVSDDLVVVFPDDDDDEGTPQPPSRRYPWSKERVQHKPTRKERRAFQRLLEDSE